MRESTKEKDEMKKKKPTSQNSASCWQIKSISKFHISEIFPKVSPWKQENCFVCSKRDHILSTLLWPSWWQMPQNQQHIDAVHAARKLLPNCVNKF